MALFGKKSEKAEKQNVSPAGDGKADSAGRPALNPPKVLVQPRVSEKAGQLTKLNKYLFIVKASANKVEVKKAVEAQYKVKVLRVNIANARGKIRNFGGRQGRRGDFRKATVTLKSGDSIKGLTEAA